MNEKAKKQAKIRAKFGSAPTDEKAASILGVDSEEITNAVFFNPESEKLPNKPPKRQASQKVYAQLGEVPNLKVVETLGIGLEVPTSDDIACDYILAYM